MSLYIPQHPNDTSVLKAYWKPKQLIIIIIIIIIIITIVLYNAPSRLPTQKWSQPSLGQT